MREKNIDKKIKALYLEPISLTRSTRLLSQVENIDKPIESTCMAMNKFGIQINARTEKYQKRECTGIAEVRKLFLTWAGWQQ